MTKIVKPTELFTKPKPDYNYVLMRSGISTYDHQCIWSHKLGHYIVENCWGDTEYNRKR